MGQDTETFGHQLRVENLSPGEYFIFIDGVAGAGGVVDLMIEEVPLAACLNRKDDDGDGRIDYPNDPGCELPEDRDESDPAVYSVCSNDEDDDEDGLIDYPLDPGCISASANDEVEICGDGVRFKEYFFGQEKRSQKWYFRGQHDKSDQDRPIYREVLGGQIEQFHQNVSSCPQKEPRLLQTQSDLSI